MNTNITVEAVIEAPVEKVWDIWTKPEHITKWCSASPDWHAPQAINDLSVGGRFNTRMESKDGAQGFDFEGTYTIVDQHKKIEYVMDGEDKRKVVIEFIPEGTNTKIIETFDIEMTNPPEFQKQGWQAILDNFKKYAEKN